VEVMPVYVVFGGLIAVIVGWAVLGYVLLYGTRMHLLALLLFALMIFVTLWIFQI
jgi:hypothetical protein